MHDTITNNQYTVSASSLQPHHDVTDQDKFDALVLSMGDKGWVGAPLVKFDDCLLSGSHRYAASEYLGIDVPVVDLFDVFSLDEASVLELVQGMDSWQAEVTYLAFEANAELARELGMDIH